MYYSFYMGYRNQEPSWVRWELSELPALESNGLIRHEMRKVTSVKIYVTDVLSEQDIIQRVMRMG